MKVDILGVGLVTAGGWSLGETWRALCNGEICTSAIPPSISPYTKVSRAALVPLADAGEYHLTSLATRAMESALMESRSGRYLLAQGESSALCLGSTSAGFSDAEQGRELRRPGYLGKALGASLGVGQVYQMSQACSASSHAIALAVDLIRLGLADIVMAGGADELSATSLSAFEAVRLHTLRDEQCRPFDLNRGRLTLGEAAAFFVLARPGIGEPIAQISGVGLSTDAMDAAAPDHFGIARAVRAAIEDAEGVKVDFVIAHGTGTKQNDLAELRALYNVYPSGVPLVSSYKGALGHPQGASGAVGLALAVQALRTQRVFPTVGLKAIDPELPTHYISTQATTMAVDHVLVMSSGSWGANAALICSRVKG